MKGFFLNFLIPILTFTFAVGVYRTSTPTVPLTMISHHTNFYDGMSVRIETYVQLESFDETLWTIGEPFNKEEVWTMLDLEANTSDLNALHTQLKENLSKQSYKRAKVSVKGVIKDNCRTDAGNTCCFGRTITIKAQEVVQLEPVEDYTKPE